MRRRERGASMVEFAIMLPLLLLVLFGLIDMGRMFLAQAMVTNGAREGVRMAVMGYPAGDVPGYVQTRADASMPNLDGVTSGTHTATLVQSCPAAPSATDAAKVEVAVVGFKWVALGAISSLFPGGAVAVPTPRATSSMRCAG